MITSKGFWSYVHKDDGADGKRISRLARDLAQQFEMLTGDTIDLFLDRDDISWGEDWTSRIDESLASTAFFIPIVTPRYFASAQCRREFQVFTSRAEQLGVKELILPLLYVEVPELHDEASKDEMALLFRSFQWEDWRDLRFKGLTTESYRRAVSRLASRLAEVNAQLEKRNTPCLPHQIEIEIKKEDSDESMGILDNLARSELALPKWTENLNSLAKEIGNVGNIVSAANIKNKGQPQTFSLRLEIAKGLALALSEPSKRIKALGDEIASQVYDVDAGFRTIIQRAPDEIRVGSSSKDSVCKFFAVVRSMQSSATAAFENIRSMTDSIIKLESLSRDLRPSLRLMRQGVEIVMTSQKVIDSWVQEIDVSGISCN